MKFDFVIGNPPYQMDPEQGSTRSLPVYDVFMDEAYKVADKVELITPARFLFNAGQTKAEWNKKMLSDPHLKVLHYEPDSSKMFPTTDIAAGVVITYHDQKRMYSPINVFIKSPELRAILAKVSPPGIEDSLTFIAESQNNYNFEVLYNDHPEYAQFISGEGRHSQLKSNALMRVPIFTKEKTSVDDVSIYGLVDGKRCFRYCARKYLLQGHRSLMKYKVLVAEAGGSGNFGDTLTDPIVVGPNIGFTQTFFSIGLFDCIDHAENLKKYIKTKFCRAMLGILKVTQHNPPIKWKYVPLQDFSSSSDIDWSAPIKAIDQQLYKKYGLSDEEIRFIETHVKEMA